MFKYFLATKSSQEAVDDWKQSQFDLADIVLALTDNNLLVGHKLYHLFKNEAFCAVMTLFKFNFKLVKQELGIRGEYVERGGDIYSPTFNPARNPEVLKYDRNKLKEASKTTYNGIIKEFKEISKIIIKKAKEIKNS